jgi:hypothetical protein
MKKSTKLRQTALLFTLSLGLLAAIPAYSAILTDNNLDSRLRTGAVTFGDLTFSDATELSSSAIQVTGAIGDSGTFTNSQKTGSFGYNMTSGSGIALSNVIAPGATNGFIGSFSATVVGATNQSFGYSLINPVATTSQGFNYSNLVRDASSGFNTLEYRGGGIGLVKSGGLYTLDLLINGNWSSQGTGVGQTQFIGITNGWAVTKNFVYNASSNQTEFVAVNSSYVLGTAPTLGFILHGSAVSAPVPVPAAIWLFSSILAGMGLLQKNAPLNKSMA